LKVFLQSNTPLEETRLEKALSGFFPGGIFFRIYYILIRLKKPGGFLRSNLKPLAGSQSDFESFSAKQYPSGGDPARKGSERIFPWRDIF